MKKVVLIFLIPLILGCSLADEIESRPFDSESWNNDPEHRYEMIDDLMNNYLILGISRSEVEAIIGKAVTCYYLGSDSYRYNNELYLEYENDVLVNKYVDKSYL